MTVESPSSPASPASPPARTSLNPPGRTSRTSFSRSSGATGRTSSSGTDQRRWSKVKRSASASSIDGGTAARRSSSRRSGSAPRTSRSRSLSRSTSRTSGTSKTSTGTHQSSHAKSGKGHGKGRDAEAQEKKKSKRYKMIAAGGVCCAMVVVATVMGVLVWYFVFRGDEFCANPIPGSRTMIKGVDMTKFDSKPFTSSAPQGYKAVVLRQTCYDTARKWRGFQMPDQIRNAEEINFGSKETETKIFNSYKDFKKERAVSLGLEGLNIYGVASVGGSVGYKRAQRKQVNESQFTTETTITVAADELTMKSNSILEMEEGAETYVEDIVTGTFESNPESYRKFILQFGTHYFASARLGGQVLMTQTISETYRKKTKKEEITAKAKVAVEAGIKNLGAPEAQAGASSGTEESEEESEKGTAFSLKFYGGQLDLLDGKLDGWQASVQDNPWLLAGNLELISGLIKDSEKSSSMERAILQYMMEQSLVEMRRLVSTARIKADTILHTVATSTAGTANAVDEAVEKAALKVVEDDLATLENQPPPLVEKDVTDMSDQVNAQMDKVTHWNNLFANTLDKVNVVVKTCDHGYEAGTDDHVFIIIKGAKGAESGEQELDTPYKNNFVGGSSDSFDIQVKKLGDIKGIEIRKAGDDDWCLGSVIVTRTTEKGTETGITYPYNKNVGDDGTVTLPPKK